MQSFLHWNFLLQAWKKASSLNGVEVVPENVIFLHWNLLLLQDWKKVSFLFSWTEYSLREVSNGTCHRIYFF
jgi:hypothetical protein